MSPIHLNVLELAQKNQTCTGMVSMRAMARLQSQLADDDSRDVSYSLQGFIDARRRPAAQLQAQATLNLPCTHCDQPLSWTVELQRSYYFVRDEEALHRIEVDDAEEEPLVGNARFDVAQLLEDELILSLPIAPRHQTCQAEVEAASGTETSAEISVQGPFSVLKGLKTRRC